MKRPLLWGFLFLILAIFLADLKVPLWVILMVSFSLVLAPIFFKGVKPAQVLFVLIIFSLGFGLTTAAIKDLDTLALYDGQTFIFDGKVESYPNIEKERTDFTVKVNTIKREGYYFDFDGRFSLSYYGKAEIFKTLKPGDQIEFSGILKALEETRNPGGFNEKLYLKAKGVDGRIRLQTNDFKIIGNETGFFEKTIQIKKWLEIQLEQAFKPELADLLKGILLGDKGIDQNIKDSFQNIGVGHILAVSGLHVGFLFLLITFLLKSLKVRKRYWFIFVGPILFLYALLTGFSASVLRASMMLLCLIIGEGWAMEKDALNNLLLAGIVILLIWPTQLFQAGFQLSMAAVLGIILFHQPLLFQIEKGFNKRAKKEKIDIYNPIIETMVLTSAVLLGTLPITIYHFGNFTLITFLANLIIIPLTGFFVIGGFLFILVASLFKIAIPLILIPLTFLGDSLLVSAVALNRINDSFDFLRIQNGSFDLFKSICFLLVGFFLAGYLRFEKKWVKALVSGMLVTFLIVFLVGLMLPGYLEVTMLDVGQGDSIVIKSPAGDYYLIDGGGYQFDRDYQISDRILYPAFRDLQIKEIEAIFLTHNHDDHKQGIEELINDGFPIEHLFMSVQTNNSALLEQTTTPVTLLKKGSKIETRDGLKIEILYPDGEISPKPDSEQNNASLVMLLSYQDVAMLFCGDMEKEAEQAILKELMAITEKQDIQIIKVGHHGSKTSSTAAFIAAVDPELALVSVGENNSYGHPHDEVLERFASRLTPVLRTDCNGAIVLKSNGQWIRSKTYLN